MNHGGKSRVIGADGVGPYATETEDVAKFDKPAVKIKFQVDHSSESLRLYVSCLSAVFVFVTLVFADMT